MQSSGNCTSPASLRGQPLSPGNRKIDILVSTAPVCDVGINNASHFFWTSHHITVFSFMDDILEPPQSVSWEAKAPSNSWSVRIAKKSKLRRKE